MATIIKQGRGELTDVVKEKARVLGFGEITTRELRLIPFAHYVMTNEQKLDPSKINEEERKILRKWKDRGWMEGGASGMTITKDFWNMMCEILYVAYVDID